MPDDSQWRISANYIAAQRAEYYATGDFEKDKTIPYTTLFQEEMEYALKNDDELVDWASNSMNWSHVKDIATELPSKKKELDFEDKWPNANKEIVEL